MVLGEKRRGISVTYTTDTRPVPAIAEYAADNDLFICEACTVRRKNCQRAGE